MRDVFPCPRIAREFANPAPKPSPCARIPRSFDTLSPLAHWRYGSPLAPAQPDGAASKPLHLTSHSDPGTANGVSTIAKTMPPPGPTSPILQGPPSAHDFAWAETLGDSTPGLKGRVGLTRPTATPTQHHASRLRFTPKESSPQSPQ